MENSTEKLPSNDLGIIIAPTISLFDLLSKNFPPTEWLVDKLIPKNGLVALSGSPGSYKSWITQYLAICVASGKPLFGKFEVEQGKVLIIDEEDSESLIQKRFGLLGATVENELLGQEIHFLNKHFLIEDKELVEKICNYITFNEIKLVIIDSLVRIYQGKDENSANHMAEVFRKLKEFQEAGSSVLFTHHHRKQSMTARNIPSESMRGSSDILASVDCHLFVESNKNEIKVVQTKLRQDTPIKPFKVIMRSDQDSADFTFIGELEETKEKAELAKMEILQVLQVGEQSREDLITRFMGNYGMKTIDKALKSLTDDEVTIRLAERGKRFYQLADLQNSIT